MLDFLIPNFHFHSIHDVPIDFYLENKISCVLFDIDNTLEPYATAHPSEKTIKLFSELKNNGIKVAVISNNHEKRVKNFCASLEVPYTFDSGKPSSKKINEIIKKLSANKGETVIVGDQLFTDIWASANSDIRGIFVDRINSEESFFIKLKRGLEIPFVSFIKKRGYGRIK